MRRDDDEYFPPFPPSLIAYSLRREEAERLAESIERVLIREDRGGHVRVFAPSRPLKRHRGIDVLPALLRVSAWTSDYEILWQGPTLPPEELIAQWAVRGNDRGGPDQASFHLRRGDSKRLAVDKPNARCGLRLHPSRLRVWRVDSRPVAESSSRLGWNLGGAGLGFEPESPVADVGHGRKLTGAASRSPRPARRRGGWQRLTAGHW